MNLVKKEKSKNVNMHPIYIIIFLKKKKTKGVNMRVKNIETLPKKKKLAINMEKSLTFSGSTKKYFLLKNLFFSGKLKNIRNFF